MQAQYYRDPNRYERYLASSAFLADINNEISSEPPEDPEESPRGRNTTYAKNLASLKTLVLVIFDQDRTVVPKESSWFGSRNVTESSTMATLDDEPKLLNMRQQPLYIEDWIGLRTLDEKGGVVFKTCVGEHMQMNDECWQPIVREYVGSREIKEVVQAEQQVPLAEDEEEEDGWVLVSSYLFNDW